MIFAKDVQHIASQKSEDARDLQLRLYRDIGISAVAAALNVLAERRDPIAEPRCADIPLVQRGDERALSNRSSTR